MISQDPFRSLSEENYQFVSNNPLRWRDPTGLLKWETLERDPDSSIGWEETSLGPKAVRVQTRNNRWVRGFIPRSTARPHGLTDYCCHGFSLGRIPSGNRYFAHEYVNFSCNEVWKIIWDEFEPPNLKGLQPPPDIDYEKMCPALQQERLLAGCFTAPKEVAHSAIYNRDGSFMHKNDFHGEEKRDASLEEVLGKRGNDIRYFRAKLKADWWWAR